MSQETQRKLSQKSETGLTGQQAKSIKTDRTFHPLDNWHQFQSRKSRTDKTGSVQANAKPSFPE